MRIASTAVITLATLTFLGGQARAQATKQAETKNGKATSYVKVTLNIYDIKGNLYLNSMIKAPSGTDAYKALSRAVPIEFDTFNFGLLVTKIAGIGVEDEGYAWKLYVDGKDPNVGLNSVILSKDATIDFKIEANPYNELVTYRIYDQDGNKIVDFTKSIKVFVSPATNAFDPLKKTVTVAFENEQTGSGTSHINVTSLAGLIPPNGKKWVLYVDGKPFGKTIDEIKLDQSQKMLLIEWKQE